ncbi:MAG TPA: hypothetical protein VFW79_12660 [Cellulomonas sp.]|uniref:hypothetical protein n=1 Tax=Cellulomonas sp. TaxID=40001 RepID=UPI002E35C46E|nr:hypothetical protein [Cellulomonas sp.]HEX5333486.1 hypothetical protein [Cellulomonas sp.]
MAALLRRWICWVSVGELAGFCVPTAAASLLTDLPPVALLGVMVVAGAVEGTVLGWTQARVLREAVPAASGHRWVTLTAAAAALAWFCGMLAPTTFETWRHWPVPVQIALGLVLGSVLLTSIGTAQWLELRRHVQHAGRWVGASALAWALGLGAFSAVSTPLWQPGQSTALIIVIGLLGGAAMAVTMAVTTGLVLRRLLVPPTASRSRRPPASTRSVATGTIR